MKNFKLNPFLAKGFFCFFLISGIGSTSKAQGSVYWYEHGQATSWNYQSDVFAFRCFNGLCFTGTFDTTIIDQVAFRYDRMDKAMEICFKPSSTNAEREELKNYFRHHPQFEVEYPVITQYPSLSASANKWYIIDDLVSVTFADKDFPQSEVSEFMLRNNLVAYHNPGVLYPSGRRYVYIFKLHPDNFNIRSSIDIARVLVETETNLIHSSNENIILEAVPNFASLRFGGESTSSFILTGSGSNTAINGDTTCSGSFPYMWNEKNTGTFVNPWSGGTTSSVDADADICECWEFQNGLSGSGVVVVVIGTEDFNYIHGDLVGSFLSGRNCTGPFPGCGNLIPLTYNTGWGFEISGLISANPGNFSNLEITGVAYNSMIFPIKIDYSYASFEKSLNEAIGFIGSSTHDPDIIVTHFYSDVPNPNVELQLTELTTIGRPTGDGSHLGIPIFATVGGATSVLPTLQNGDNANYYPAAYSNVISVLNATPNDKLKEVLDGWGTSVGDFDSNFGSQYDFSASGSWLMTPLGAGAHVSHMDPIRGALATASGVGALLLEGNPGLFWYELRQAMRDGADQVGGYNYSSGVSNEFGHGRISCLNSALQVIGIDDLNNLESSIQIQSPVSDEIIITYDIQSESELFSVQVFDVLGQNLFSGSFRDKQGEIHIDSRAFSEGIYLVTIGTENSKEQICRKIVKF